MLQLGHSAADASANHVTHVYLSYFVLVLQYPEDRINTRDAVVLSYLLCLKSEQFAVLNVFESMVDVMRRYTNDFY